MIQFRQKIFLAPAMAGMGLMNAIGIAGIAQGGAQMIQSSKQMEQQQQMQRQSDLMARKNAKMQADALNNIANKAPQMGTQIAPKLFSAKPGFFKNARQVARDMLIVGNKNGKLRRKMTGMLATGATFGALAYGTNKLIAHDARKNGLLPEQSEEDIQEAKNNRKKSIKKIALGTLATAGTLAASYGAAKRGFLGKKAQNFATNNITRKNIKGQASIFKRDLRDGFKEQFSSPGAMIATTAFGVGFPLLSYLPEKIQKQKQQEVSKAEEQKTYSFRTGLRRFIKNPVKRILSGMSSFMGTGGEKGLSNFSKKLRKQGKNSLSSGGSNATIKVADFLERHPKTGLVGAIGIGSAIWAPMGWGEKTVSKAADLVDNDANAYSKFKEKQVQQ